MNPQYQIFVKDKQGDTIGEFSAFLGLDFADTLNNYGMATFNVPMDSKDAVRLISLRQYEIYIVRDGVTIWAGEQVNANVTIQANDANLIQVTCYTFPEMLNSRVTLPFTRFEDTDQAEILKALVDESQGRTDGDFGFTFAPITPTMNRDREYKLANILESFVNMSNVINGVDFWIDENKVIRFASERGSDKSGQYKLELGVNIMKVQIADNFSSPGNTVFAVGESSIESYVDTATRAIYLLREQTLSAIDVSESATLIGKAEDMVAKNKNQIRTITISQLPNTNPNLSKLSVGDSMNVTIKKGRYNINAPYRIYGYEVKIGENGEEYINWILSDI